MKSEADIHHDLYKLGVELSKIKGVNLIHTYTPKQTLEGGEKVKSLDAKIRKIDTVSKRENYSIASIDSSSRMLRSTFLDLIVIGASMYSTERGIITFPFDISGRYLGVASYLDVLRKLESELSDPSFALVNIVGYEYAVDEVEVITKMGIKRESLYHLDDVADELRLEAENNLIKESKEELLILDGPLFPTPIELYSDFEFGIPKNKDEIKHWGRITHRWAYAQLIKERLDMIKKRKVIGVVKRLESSRKLRLIPEIRQILGINGIPDLNDAEVLEMISAKECNIGVCLIGPFQLNTDLEVKREDVNQVVLSNIPEKYAYYAILKLPGGLQSFFRIESLDLNLLDEVVSIVFQDVTEDLLPTYISIVDSYAKKLAKGLYYLSFNVLKDFVTFLHDTRIEALSISREMS